MASSEKLEDLNITQEELEKITECLKQEEFKKLFFEYAEEISNPENRARYESEIRQLENERGMDVKFVNPEPGYVIKTTIGGEVKAFINVCKNDNVGKPSSEKKVGKDGQLGLSWQIPHSFTPPREDVDREKNKCQVFDFVVHPDTYRMAETNLRFKQMVNDIAIDGLRKQFDVDPDTKNLKFPKMKYKGTATPTVIRTRLSDAPPAVDNDPSDIMSKFPYPYDNETSAEKAKQREEKHAQKHSKKKKDLEKKNETKEHDKSKASYSITGCSKAAQADSTDSDFAVPKYTLTHRSEIDFQDYASDPDIRRKSTHPRALVVEISLPLLSSAAHIQLDIFERQLKLVSLKPAKYKLEVTLPYAVNENHGSARFDKARRKLVVTLPVVPLAAKTEPLLLLGDDLSCGSGDHSIKEQEDKQHQRDDDTVQLIPNVPSQPLIAEISSTYENDCQRNTSVTRETERVSSENRNTNQETQQADSAVFRITQILPEYECVQTPQTVQFDFHVFKVCRENVSLISLSTNAVQIKMVSVGEGGFPVYYSCYVAFDDDCCVLTSNSQLDVMRDKVVLTLVKDNQSVGLWSKYSVGIIPDSLETRQFIDNSEMIKDTTAAFISPEPHSDFLQADSCGEVQMIVCDSDNADSSREECKIIADCDNSADTSLGNIYSSAVSLTQNSLSLAVDGEVLESTDETLANMSDISVTRELDTATPSDTCSGQVVDHSYADSYTANITGQHVVNGNASSEFDPGTNDNLYVKAESVNLESNHDVEHNPEVNEEATRSLVEELADTGPAQSTVSQEPNMNDHDQPTRPNTMLSWSEPSHDAATSKTKCAIQFENSVIFDLDVE